jgi:hypothetical protein
MTEYVMAHIYQSRIPSGNRLSAVAWKSREDGGPALIQREKGVDTQEDMRKCAAQGGRKADSLPVVSAHRAVVLASVGESADTLRDETAGFCYGCFLRVELYFYILHFFSYNTVIYFMCLCHN